MVNISFSIFIVLKFGNRNDFFLTILSIDYII